MYKYLLDIIKKIEGNVIGIGIEDKLLDGFKRNNKVNVYTINKSISRISFFKSKKRTTSSGKIINIKKLYKYFKKNSVDYIICNIEEVNDYLKYFIRDGIYLNKNKIYLFGNKNDMDIDLLNKRFNRYNSKIDIKEFKDNILLIIDNTNSKTNSFKNIIYFISDTLYNLIDFISNVFIS